ncbi:MAG: hypothetical protein EOO38_30715 [Cytophagaceae bacterium]|nr:MAG: hypothetical protein EOO38_30715 [Cytophagaceae bacterium]
MEYENEQRGYDGMSALPTMPRQLLTARPDEPRGYERDRSRSPRGERRDVDSSRARSASPGGARDSRYVLPHSAIQVVC